jgi:hypothetical protein
VSGPQYFGDLTHWDKTHADPNSNEPAGGWYPPGQNYFIRDTDPCWNRVLDQARQAYGDPNIHYNTDSDWEDRHLVFGDGTNLPEDGMVVYHDSGTKQNWAQNGDGTASLVGADGKPGPPITPTGYRKIGDRYAPVDSHGQQIAPQLGGVPSSDNGFYTDPKTGMLTPKNANGDYFTVGADGKKSFFDKTGAPITEDQFNHATKPRDPASQNPPPDGGLATDEQQSGKAADAVKKLQDELKHRYSTISDAEEHLSEVLLNAHATTTAGQQKLDGIQKKIVEAVNNPTMAMDTPAGERSFLNFLRSQVSAINDVLSTGAMSAQDQGKTAQALAALYAADSGAGTDGDPAAPQPPAPAPAPAAPAVPEPDPSGSGDPGVGDPGLGPAPQMPDPSLSDVLGGAPMGADPLSSLASTLPSALSGLGGLGGGAGSPLDSLGGLAGAAAPLAGLASGLGDQGANHDHGSDTADRPDKADDSSGSGKDGKDGKGGKADTTEPAGSNQQPAGGQPAQQDPSAGGPPPPVAAPAGPSTTVKLPDGSPAAARTPQTAQAIRDYLGGDTIDAAYRKNGIQLPPPGTPVTSPVDPSHLSCGDVAMFKDHYVPVLSAVKAFVNGQVVPLGSVSSSPDFLGFIDPTAAAAAGPPAGPPASASVAPPAPAAPPAAVAPPASSLAEPSTVG